MLAAMRLALEKVKVKISNLRDAQDAFEGSIANNTDLGHQGRIRSQN